MIQTRRPIRAVVFDLDDTLYHEVDYVRGGLSAVGADLRRNLRRREDFAGWMWRQFKAGQREHLFGSLDEHFALDLSPGQILDCVHLYRTHKPRLRPCRGVATLLQRMRRAGVKVGLLSDGFLPAKRLKFEVLGLA
jgi:putative hydrolase of the HAD superfamily